MISDDWWPETGGGPVHVRELSCSLAEHHGCEVDIFTRSLKKDGERYDEVEEYMSGDVTVYRLPPCTEYWNPAGRISSLVTPIPRLLSNSYDIIHGHTFLPAVPTKIAGGLSSTPTVFTVHGTALTTGVGRDSSVFSGIKRHIEKQFILEFNYDSVISVNEKHVDLLDEYHSSVTTIPNGVDYDRFSVSADRTIDVLYLGRLTERKRISKLIEAFSEVNKVLPDANLCIGGEGPKRTELESEVETLGLENSVTFRGRVPDEELPQLYGSAKVFVLPSAWEGHPLTLLEAWSAGTPVVAPSVEGIEEFVDHGTNGVLTSSVGKEELSAAILMLLKNPDLSHRLGDQGRDLVKNEYTWKIVSDRTYNAYQRISEEKTYSI
ncbi:glycosyltransferase family 4 protein [Halogeometricum luteum]|uniref:Glycosyltransferase family 4 protein n=1 Tax=Halogeometricum luteum TaxID=2950537 RepID=A0ABU2G546_9EURY|nr:glycosyltransferase family 4 protein [Halogeometricum sp. S3BR5-2]MDS0295344.1 glycosyltransferase family 4 protein [Halogeometricum sp. S3BR5-2]